MEVRMLNQRRLGGLCARAARELKLWLGALGMCLIATGSAHAYDLSRSYESLADEVERGFVVGSVALWMPEVGNWSDFHQLSLDFGGEFGFRFASIKGAHNLYVVAGLNISPQLLDPDAVRYRDDRGSNVVFAYGGIRYLPSQLCFGDGLGCPFIEFRLGLVFESTAAGSGHEGPSGSLTVVPGLGYRFSFGRVFQLGGRLDVSYTEEYDVYDLGWLSLTGFAGIGW
jgi:hypothetical protein